MAEELGAIRREPHTFKSVGVPVDETGVDHGQTCRRAMPTGRGVPAMVPIPAHEVSVSFPISTIDAYLVNAPQLVAIYAHGTCPECGCSIQTGVTATFEVAHAVDPTVTISLDDHSDSICNSQIECLGWRHPFRGSSRLDRQSPLRDRAMQ